MTENEHHQHGSHEPHEHHGYDGEHHGSHHVDFDTAEMAAYAELEGEVLAGLVEQATSVLAARCAERGIEVRRILDIGSGPGVGTCLLADRFGGAAVVAVDGSATMLGGVEARAERLGFADRVTTLRAELPTDLSAVGRADVVWASMVLHHIGDEVAGLRQLGDLLEPGGLLAVVEREGPVRALPADLDDDRPGTSERLEAAWAAWFEDMRAGLPGATTSVDYPTMFDAAGLDLVVDEVRTLDLVAPLDERARRFAHRNLASTRTQLAAHADPADLETLDALVDDAGDASILRRDDISVRTSRHLYVATVAPRR